MRLKNLRPAAVMVMLASLGAGPLALAGSGTDTGKTLHDILISASRLDSGVTGASVSVITADQIENSPGQTLQDILARQPGVQVQDLYGGVDGADSTVDLRGFGAAATPNTLVLLNGRRLNDFDLSGVDFGSIPKASIARIEIIRGNAGAVLYGDGAVGGVINIITRNAVHQKPLVRADQSFGSFDYRQTNLAAGGTLEGTSISAYGSSISSDGYRQNNYISRHDIVADARRTLGDGQVFLDVSATSRHIGLPGPLSGAQIALDPRSSDYPPDNAGEQAFNTSLGGVFKPARGIILVVDAAVRHKNQQSSFFDYGDSFYDTALTRVSLTPRIEVSRRLFALPVRSIAGVDLYQTDYHSNQQVDPGTAPVHHYGIRQRTLAAYWQNTISIGRDTGLSLGLRVQDDRIRAHDRYDPSAPNDGNFVAVQGLPLSHSSLQYAFDAGFEHRLSPGLRVFGRLGRSFRLPTADERVGKSPWGVPTDFALRTQTSDDAEVGVRARWGVIELQSSAYLMKLHNELHYDPVTYTNVNLGPTRRYGVENALHWDVGPAIRADAGLTYTRAQFTSGTWNGNTIPLVSRWSGYGEVTWRLVRKRATLNADILYVGSRRFDNDQANVQPLIPAHTVMNVGLGGTIGRVHYSLAIQNLFGRKYFDYGVASTTAYGVYNAYPMPGRTIKGQIGLRF